MVNSHTNSIDNSGYQNIDFGMLSAVVENISDSFFVSDNNLNYVAFNKAHVSSMKEMYGVDIEVGKRMPDYLVVGDDSERVITCLKKALRGETVCITTSLGFKETIQRIFEISITPVFNSGNEVVGVTVLSKDVSDFKNASLALNESDNRSNPLFDKAPLSYQLLDVNGCLLDVNGQWLEMLGYERCEVVGKKFSEFVAQVYLDYLQKQFEQFTKEGKIHYELEVVHKSGRNIYVSVDGKIGYDADRNFKQVHCILVDITAKKIAENNLSIERNKIDAAFQNPSMGFVISNGQGSELRMNETALRFHDFESIEDMLLRVEDYEADWELYYPEGRKMEYAEWPLVRATKGDFVSNMEILYVNLRTQRNWICSLTSSPVYSDAGELLYIIQTLLDITEQKLAEKALRLSEEKFRTAFLTSPDCININRMSDGMYLALNNGFTSSLGYSEAETLGHTSLELNIWHDVSDRKRWVDELIRYGEVRNFETQFRAKDGRIIYALVSSAILDLEEGKHVISISRDITERKIVEQALHDSERKLSTLFSSMTEMVVMHELIMNEYGDPVDYKVVDCNDAFVKLIGISKGEMIGKVAADIFHTEKSPFLDKYIQVAISGEPYKHSIYYEPLDKYLLISAVSTGLNLFSTIITDITAIKQVQEEILAKNKELENYLYVASHDLRSPLVNIQGFGQRLAKQSIEIKSLLADCPLEIEKRQAIAKITDEAMPRSLDFILSNVLKMDSLIKSLLEISRTGRLLLVEKKININDLMTAVVAAKNFQLTEISAKVTIHKLTDCYGDENQLNQLFSNLIDNAIKYRDKNRKLVIEINSTEFYNKVVYSVSDNGQGIAEKYMDKIWDIFYRIDSTVSEKGDGIGLSIAKTIAGKHKGKIWVESEEGKGSTFFVELQLKEFSE